MHAPQGPHHRLGQIGKGRPGGQNDGARHDLTPIGQRQTPARPLRSHRRDTATHSLNPPPKRRKRLHRIDPPVLRAMGTAPRPLGRKAQRRQPRGHPVGIRPDPVHPVPDQLNAVLRGKLRPQVPRVPQHGRPAHRIRLPRVQQALHRRGNHAGGH